MFILRRAIVSALTMLLVALALPAFGQPAKIFSLNISATGNPLEYRATFKNETPNGNSTINSVILMAPAGTKILTATPQNGTPTITGTGTNTINVANMPGIKAGGNTWYLTITLDVSSPPCIAWNARAFTGNSFGGTEFALLPPPSSSLTIGGPSPGCQIVLTMAPPSVNQNTNAVPMTATFANPSINAASFSALTLTAPAGLTIASATLPNGTTGTLTALPGGAVSVTNISPAVAPGASLVLSLTVNVGGACGNTDVFWSAVVYAGPALSGQQFALAPPPPPGSQLKTTIVAAACSLSFSPDPPKNGISGQNLPTVTVIETGGSGTVTVNMSSNCSLSGVTSANASGGSASFGNLIITTGAMGASCTLTAKATGYPDVTSQSFTVFASGPLNCEPTPPFSFDASISGAIDVNHTGYAAGLRGQYNKDGSTCHPVGYTFVNDILANNQVLLQWDTSVDPGAAFEYTMTWKPEYVDPTTGMPNRVTKVAWYVGGVLTTPVPGRACIAQNPNGSPTTYLPAPYGTLATQITSAGQASFDVTTSVTPPTPPFAIQIGSERMTVTLISGSTWTVTRSVGGTSTPPANYPIAIGTQVMSNPLPLDGAGLQMRVCIAEEGFSIVPPGSNDCPTTATVNPNPLVTIPTVPTACVLYTTTVYDIGDGVVGRGSP